MVGDGPVVFDYQAWSQQFPALAPRVNEALASACFDQATLYLNNTNRSTFSTAARRAMVLYLITAHLATLRLPGPNGSSNDMLVGRISNASEGSVSLGTDMTIPNSAAWWGQTRYGLDAWQAMASRANARPILGPRPVFDPYPRGYR